MKIYPIYLCALLVCFAACTEDQDDLNLNPEVISSEFEVVTADGIPHYTGLLNTFCYGFTEGYPHPDSFLDALEIPEDLPEAFDLSEFLPPVGDQGRQGSCVAWATTYYLKSLQEKIQFGYDYTPSTIMSPAYIYNQITMGECQGTAIPEALDLLFDKGATSIESFPYNENFCSPQPTEAQDQEALPNRIEDFQILSGENMVNEMKTLLVDQKPIVLAVGLDDEFGAIDSFGLSAYREHLVTEDDIDSAHAMLAVGYSDEFEAFKLVNSWGVGEGPYDGFVWVDYKAFENVLDTTYQFRVICEAYVTMDAE